MENGSGREVVLVTGYPRAVARLVAEEVLATNPRRVVKLLVRTKFAPEAEVFARSTPHGGRVELLEGDAAAIDLGLSGREFCALADEVDYIQHHAQLTYEGTEPRAAEALNVQGAREVLELARAARKLARLVHHSSARVSGDHAGRFDEDDLDVGQGFRSHIDETLFRGERLVRGAMAKLPVTVLRPSIMVGHSVTGEIDRLDGLYMLVLLILTSPVDLTLPLPARGDAPLNLVPIDYVARAAVALMDAPGAAGRTVHVVDPAPPPARRIYELVAAAAGRKPARGFIPANVTRALLRTPGLERFVKSPRAFLEQLATPVSYGSRGARDLLEPRGVACPSFESYVDALVAHVRERLAARRAERAEVRDEVEDPFA